MSAREDTARPDPGTAGTAAEARSDAGDTGRTEAPSPTSARPRRRWLRRLARLAVGLAVLAVALRVALPFALPPIVDRVAAGYDLEVGWDDLDLSLLGGALELWHLEVRPRTADRAAEGGASPAPLLQVEYLTVDVDVSALLGGALVVRRLEVDGLDALVEREADGTLAFARHLPKPAPVEAGADSSSDPAALSGRAGAAAGRERAPIDLAPPLRVDALRLQHARFRVVDRTVSPPLEVELQLMVRVSDLGAADRDTRLEVLATVPGVLDALRVDGHGRAAGPRLDAELTSSIRGLQPRPLAPWLAEVGLAPVADVLAAGLALEAHVEPVDERGESCRASLAVRDVALTVDRVKAAGIDAITVEVPELSTAGAEVALVELRGVRGAAERTRAGTLRMAGLELGGAPAAAPSRGEDAPAAEPAEASSGGQPSYPVGVAMLRLADLELRFADAAVEPPTELALRADALELADLVLADPARPDATARLTGTLQVPGVVERVALQGELSPSGPERSAEIAVDATGLFGERVAPYLAPLGLASTVSDGTAGLRIAVTLGVAADGATTLAARLSDVHLTDGDAELAALDRLEVRDTLLDADGVRVGAIEIEGTRLPLRRDASGSLHALGLRTVPATGDAGARTAPRGAGAAAGGTRAPTASAPAAAPGPGAPASLPRLAIDRFAWTDNRLSFVDETTEPRVEIVTETLEASLEDLVLGVDGSASARLAARLVVPGLLDPFTAAGTISAESDALELAIDAAGSRLATAALRPWLDAAGVTPTFETAEISGRVRAAVRMEPGASLVADLALEGLSLADPDGSGDGAWTGVEAVRVTDARVSPSGVLVGAIEVVRPVLRAGRDADGSLLVAGVRLPTEPAGAAVDGSEPAAPRAVAAAAGADVPTEAGSATAFAVERLALVEATVRWTDAGLTPPVSTRLVANATVEGLAPGSGGPPARLSADLAIADALERLAIEGELGIDGTEVALEARVSMRGLSVGPLARYLPPGVRGELADGRLDLALSAGLGAADAGGSRAHLAVTDLAFRDGPDGAPLLAFDRAAVTAPRIDLAGGEVLVEELVLAGLELDARRTSDGGLAALGFAIAPPPAGEASDAGTVAAASGGGEAPAEASGAEEPAPRRPVRRALAGDLPSVRIETLDLALERLTITDDTSRAEPVVASLRLAHPEPLVLLGPEPAELPPITLALDGAVEPAIGAIDLDLVLEPWLDAPRLGVTFAATGVSGTGLLALAPGLSDTLDGSDLEDGRIEARLEAHLDLGRRDPLAFDLAGGFGLDVALTDLALEDGAGEILAGVDDLRVEVKRVDPATGDVHVRSIMLTRPMLRARRDAAGDLHALGLVLKAAAIEAPAGAAAPRPGPVDAPTPEGVAGAVPVEAGTRPGAAATRTAGAPDAPSPVIAIDEIVLASIDVQLRDDFVAPPLVVPLTDLDVQVRGFSTRALVVPEPVTFSAFLNAGEVPLPERKHYSSALTGFASATASALTGGSEEVRTVERRLFDEVAVTGRTTLSTPLEGWVKLSVRGLELPAFRGAAATSGVEIGDGVVDTTTRLRFRGAKGLDVDTKTTFTYLSLSEPPNGPISRFLRLPAPLDTVLFVLKNAQGQHVIPASFHMSADGLSARQITSTAVRTISQVIARAVASSPLRLTGTVTGLLGLTGGPPPEPVTEETVALSFVPGATTLRATELGRLDSLVQRLSEDDGLIVILQHELGSGDVAQAELLANPSAEDCRELAARLHQRRAELVRESDLLAADARACYALGRTEAAREASAALRAVDRELGRTEQALDRVYQLLRPGADRRRDSRTREAALAIAEQRLDVVRRALIDRGPPDTAQRVQVRDPRFLPSESEAGGSVQIVPRRTE